MLELWHCQLVVNKSFVFVHFAFLSLGASAQYLRVRMTSHLHCHSSVEVKVRRLILNPGRIFCTGRGSSVHLNQYFLCREDRRFAQRRRHHYWRELEAIIEEILADKTTAEWTKILQEGGIAAGPVNTAKEVRVNFIVGGCNKLLLCWDALV